MRVALLAGWYYPESIGGTEAYVHALAKDLKSRGCEVVVASPNDQAAERGYTFDDVPVYRYPVDPAPSDEEAKGLSEPRFLGEFRAWLEELRPDIVHSHSFSRGCGEAHLRCASTLHIPTVVTVHTPNVVCSRGTLMRWGRVPCDGRYSPVRCATCSLQERGLPRAFAWPVVITGQRNPPKFLPSRARTALQIRHLIDHQRGTITRALTRADRTVAVSEWLLNLLVEAGVPRERIMLSAQGLTGRRPAEAGSKHAVNTADRMRVAYVGRFDAVKGVDVLIRALRSIPREAGIDLHLFGVASGRTGAAYLDSLHRLAAADERITFHPPMSEDDRYAILRSMHLLAVPSMWFETGPLVVLEAFAAGIPVLGSDMGGIPERVTHRVSGYLVPPGDVSAWANALIELRQRLSSGQWNWRIPKVRTSQDVADDMSGLYEEVLINRRAREARAEVRS